MSPDFTFTIDIAGVLALGGVIWGFAKMSGKLDALTTTVESVGKEIGKIVGVLASLSERVGILEDRSDRSHKR